MIALALLTFVALWTGVAGAVALWIGKTIAAADREQAKGQAHFEAELKRWDMAA